MAHQASRVVSRQDYLSRHSQARQRSWSNGAAARGSYHQGHAGPLTSVGELLSGGGGGYGAGNYGGAAYPCSVVGSSGVAMQPLANVNHRAPVGMPSSVGAPEHYAAGSKVTRQVKDNFVNRVVQRCGPAVVRVETEQKVELPGLDNSDVFSFFFGVRPDARRKERRVHGHGSGFCIDGNSGVILTNAHVVQGADRIMANFAGRGEPLECEVLETDEVIDLAAIKVKARISSPLPSMTMGASETVRPGDWAIVLGNPLGLQNTCTLGIVSSLDRSTGETGFDWMRHPLLQTDAAVNQGNSGGPMLNELGEVIGVISMRALFGEGIGFAIPVDSIKSALPSLLKRAKVPRAYLGLKMTAEAPDGGRRREGALVELVLPRSPADKAGLEAGDELLEVQGRRIKHFEEVQSIVRSAHVGGKVNFKFRRGSETRSVAIATADIRHLREGGAQGRSPQGGHRRIVIIPN